MLRFTPCTFDKCPNVDRNSVRDAQTDPATVGARQRWSPPSCDPAHSHSFNDPHCVGKRRPILTHIPPALVPPGTGPEDERLSESLAVTCDTAPAAVDNCHASTQSPDAIASDESTGGKKSVVTVLDHKDEKKKRTRERNTAEEGPVENRGLPVSSSLCSLLWPTRVGTTQIAAVM